MTSITFYLARILLIHRALENETQEITAKQERLRINFQHMQELLATHTLDYASWDDTYAFMHSHDPAYISSNFIPATLEHLGLNLAVLIDIKGEILFAKYYDLKAGTQYPIPEPLLQLLQIPSVLTRPQPFAIQGLIQIASAPALIASYPVLTSDDGGEPRGVLIFAKPFDSEKLTRLERLTGLSLDVIEANSPLLTQLDWAIDTHAPPYQRIHDTYLYFYTPFQDIFGHPLFAIEVSLWRGFMQQTHRDLIALLLLLLLVGSIGGLSIILMLERLVLSKLSRLTTFIKHTQQSRILTNRIHFFGKDELATLAHDINILLATLADEIALRVNKEREARESSEHFARLFHLSSVAMALLDVENGRFIDVNEGFLQLSGYRRDEVIGKTSQKLDLFLEQGDRIHLLQRLRANGKINNLEIPFKNKSGQICYILLSADIVQNKGQPFLLTVGIDITQRKHIERELAQSREQYMLAVNGSNDGIWDWDLRSNNLFLSPQWKQILGYDEHELENSLATFERLIHPKDHPRVMAYVDRYLQGEISPYNIEFRMLHQQGEYIWILARGSMLKDEHGIPYRMAGSHTDISLRKQSELALLEAKQLAIDATRAKSEFLANMSHEIRTPLNGVIGMTWLLFDTPLNNTQKHYVQTIHNSGNILLSLINDILDFSKIEAGHLEIMPVDFSLHTLLEEFASAIAFKAQAKGLEFLCDISPKIPPLLHGDAPRLTQILNNLVGNAIKFTQQGEIILRIEPLIMEATQIRLRFLIIDTGIGIAKDKQDLLFEKFSQVDASSTREFEGTGLGLAISKQLAILLDGNMGVESEKNHGSTFWFELPFKHSLSAAAASEASLSALECTDSPSILLVDDNHSSCDILSSYLKQWKLCVRVCHDGPEALAALYTPEAQSNPYTVIIIDCKMPLMEGTTLCQAIRADPRFDQTRLVLMLSADYLKNAEHAKPSCFDAYLHKPVYPWQLKTCLNTLCKTSQLKLSADTKQTATPPPTQPVQTTQALIGTFASLGKRVLLVEDNPINRQVVVAMLEKLGLEVDEAKDGAGAIACLEIKAYDLVIMDIQMPVMDGIMATQIIRDRSLTNREASAPLPVIAMTAHAMSEDEAKCMEAGMNAYLTKPVDVTLLCEALKRWL